MPSERSAAPAVYTIPPSLSFVDQLAAWVLARAAGAGPQELARTVILLPTRRACRALQEAFLRHSEGRPMLLPQMVPLGDIDEDEILFDSRFAVDGVAEIPPAIGVLCRRVMLTRLVQQGAAGTLGHDIPVDQAARLAGELARLLDQVQTERLGFDGLAGLVPADYAEHWQLTLEFLTVVTRAWPELLAAEAAIDPAERRNLLLAARAEQWRRNPPATPVIAAGSTGSIPATADLLGVVAGLPQGAVILPGLDTGLDDDAWAKLEPSHPQYGLRQLLAHLDVPRAAVRIWDGEEGVAEARAARVRFVGAALRPAAVSDDWRSVGAVDAGAFDGVTRIDCATPDEEAGVISLILRRALDSDQAGQTAALVTTDRALARRVARAMARWDVAIDDSAGAPLADTPPGLFLRLAVRMAAEQAAPVPLLALLKHPLAAVGRDPAAARAQVRMLELKLLRGPRRAPGMAALARAAAGLAKADPDYAPAAALAEALAEAARAFAAALSGGGTVGEMLAAHIGFAEALAASDTQSGAERLWAGEAGEALANFVAELADTADTLGALSGTQYPALFDELLAGRVVRPRYGGHPRLAILGPLEARLQHYDVMVLGGLNEGSWPPEAPADPWMSRPMRAEFGLPAPERRTGLSAHDFAQAFCAGEVYLTRAARVEGTPTVPARWLTRLEFAAEALGLAAQWRAVAGQDWLAWQAAFDAAPDGGTAPDRWRPRPAPPVEVRPRELWVTEIETWMRDPYAIFARRILELSALAPIDQAPDAADYGSRIHAVLDCFLADYPAGPLPADAPARLHALGAEMLAPIRELPAVWTFWWPRFERIAAWFLTAERARRETLAQTHTEVTGTLDIAGPQGRFQLHARADRVDLLADGRVAIVDFKTGAAPRANEVAAGFAPQLPLEAAIAAAGGFEGIGGSAVAALEYWRLSGGRVPGEINLVGGDDPAELAARAQAGLTDLVTAFDDPATPYESRPRAEQAPRYSDYEHLARVKEWSAGGDGDGL